MKKLLLLMVMLIAGCAQAVTSNPMRMAMAATVLDASGHLRTTGPHIDPRPIYHARVNGKWVEVAVQTAALPGPAKAKLAIGPTTVTPPLPSDYGATVDASGAALFGTGLDDVNQRQADDCYLLAVWDSLCRQNPAYAKAILVRDGAGMNSLTFRRSLASPVTVRMNSLISAGVWATPSPTTGAIDACLVEKGYFYFRTSGNVGGSVNTVASGNFGFPGNVMSDLGISNSTVYASSAGTATAVMATLKNGYPCAATTASVVPAGIPIVASHCYCVLSADSATITLRNPWGANGQGAISGGVNVNPPGSTETISWTDFGKSFSSVSCGTSYAGGVVTVFAPSAKITSIDHVSANFWDGIKLTFTASNGTPAVTVSPSAPTPITVSNGVATFAMPNAACTVTVTVTAPNGTTATDSRNIALR